MYVYLPKQIVFFNRQICLENMIISALVHDVKQTGTYLEWNKNLYLEETKAVRAAVEEAVQLGEGEGQLRGGSTSNIWPLNKGTLSTASDGCLTFS